MSKNIIGAGGCFRKGTLVQQEHGKTIAIEDLSIGDSVLAFDDKNNTYCAKVVKVHYHSEPQPILHVKYWGGELFATPNHWVVNQLGTFAELGTLTEEDALQDGLGHLRPILSMEVIGYEPVYNLTVEPWHTFIANGIRVHNGGHRESYPTVRGAGGGGKGGGGKPAQEAANTLKSIQYAEIIDVISEGEIGGLVNGSKSIFLDGVPLENSDGTANFTNVSYSVRTGTQTQDPVPSAGSGVSATYGNPASSNPIKYGSANAQEISITNTNVKSVDVTIAVPALTYQDTSTGDLNGNSVSFKIYYKTVNTSFTVVHDATIEGKCTSLYQKAYTVSFLNAIAADYPITLRVERTKADSTTSNIQDKMYWYSYTEHIPTILNYPNTALINFKIDAEQFSSIPTRGYEIYGIKVRVPSNYNPTTRVYTGEWNGTFSTPMWTDNPAWIFYDLVTENRYGLGSDLLTESSVDKWALYTIAKYCDELVPTGFKENGVATYEPRFTCNAFIYTQDDAYRLLGNITSVFRAMQYWALGQFSLSVDMPKDPIMQFTPANVIDGQFTYSGSSMKTRHTVAAVTWNDPKDMCKQKIEYVEDTDGINRYGIIQTDIIAFGCTSRGQAHRLGKWLLYSEQMETETVTFKTGIENCIMLPGDIIQTTDPFRAGDRYGGRILSFNGTSAITLDTPPPVGTYNLVVYTPYKDTQGNLRGKLTTIQGEISSNVFTAYVPITAEITTESVWVATAVGTIEPEYWRVIGIKEEDDHISAVITALEYRKDKFAFVENDIKLEERPVSTIDYSKPDTPYLDTTTVFQGPIVINGITYATYTNALSWCQEYLYYAGPGILSNGVTISWSGDSTNYKVRWKLTTDTVWSDTTTSYPYLEIKPIKEGAYNVEIYAVNTLNKLSDPLQLNMTILGKAALPNEVTGLTIAKQEGSIYIAWNAPDNPIYTKPDLDLAGYEIRELYSTGLDPYTKLSGSTVVWKDKIELGAYLGTVLTDDQYYQKLNDKWDTLAKAEQGLIKNTSYIDISALTGYNTFLVKAVDTSGNYSKIPALIGIELKGPSSVTVGGITVRIDGEDLVVTWPRPSSDTKVDNYVVAIDGQTYTVYTEEFRRKAWFIGTEVFDVTPYDKAGNSAAKVSLNITIEDNLAPQNLSYSIVDDLATVQVLNDSFKLTWNETAPSGLSLPIVEYEIRIDANFGQAIGLIAKTSSKQYVSKVTWGGSKTLYVGAKNSAGFYTPYSSKTISIVSPNEPTTVTSKVVDNNVLLYWTAPTAGGSLPIDEYVIKKGATLGTAIDVGTKAGNFTTVFETVGGDYVYWVAAKDTAGNIGTYKSTAATVNQPPDYVLQFDYTSDYSTGTKTNAVLDSDNNLILPVYSTETFTGHFSVIRITTATINAGGTGYAVGDTVYINTGTYTYRAVLTVTAVSAGVVTGISIEYPGIYSVAPTAIGSATLKITGNGTGLTVNTTTATWTTPQNQIDAGYPIYIQPELPSGSYIEVKDYGTTLVGNTVTITTDIEEVVTGAIITYKIESSPDNLVWTLVSDAKSGFATNFRYLRVTVTVTNGLIKLKLLNTKIDSKLKTQSASKVVNAADTNGTIIYLTKDYTSTGTKVFKDVQSITVTPSFVVGSQPIAIYDFTDIADPLYFSIYLYDSLTGNRLSGTCSYTVRGV